jgi:predicted transcriptional regulator YdeE
MNYRIEKKDAIRIVGVKLTTTMDDGKNLREIPEFWEQCNQNGKSMEIAALIDKEPFGLLGVCTGMPSEGGAFDYYIAASTDKSVPEGMAEYTIPAVEWAIFESVGALPNALQELDRRIYAEWLPASGYEYGSSADIEVYSKGDTSASDYKAEIWAPIAKKQRKNDSDKILAPVKNCVSCGMPMKEQADFADGDVNKAYCVHCARPDGTMQSFEEKRVGLAAFIAKTRGIDETEALAAAESAMKKLPAWKGRFS